MEKFSPAAQMLGELGGALALIWGLGFCQTTATRKGCRA